jgi:putative transposase
VHQGGFSFQVRRQFSGEVWQTGFHEHRIRDEQDFQNQMAYIAANPERRHLMDHRFVHTCYRDQIDPMPMMLQGQYLRG